MGNSLVYVVGTGASKVTHQAGGLTRKRQGTSEVQVELGLGTASDISRKQREGRAEVLDVEGEQGPGTWEGEDQKE